ncbi:MAG: TPM domain-containing protein [Chlorobi bacterium]|nr:TPM domain-containing protein [Chlorobiota bacterium]
MLKKYTSLIVLVLTLLNGIFAADIPQRPVPPRLVNDLAGILGKSETEALEWKLRALNDSTSNQILIITLKSLNGYDPASFAYEIGEKWGVGQKGFNNGIVVLVKPKISNTNKGQAFIAVGYGLEGAIPDAIAKRIVEKEMIPSFRRNNYGEGIFKGVDVLSKLASGEISAEGYNKGSGKPAIFGFLPFIIIFLIIVIIRASNARSGSMGRNNMSFWTALWIGSSLSGGSGHWNNFSGSSGGFGGGGGGFGGGFGGFGGGSFGGGGAGGSW